VQRSRSRQFTHSHIQIAGSTTCGGTELYNELFRDPVFRPALLALEMSLQNSMNLHDDPDEESNSEGGGGGAKASSDE
jgi:hypothetical protein